MTTRFATLVFVSLLTGGCAAYDEGPGAQTPQVEYANASAQANVETATTTSDEVYIGDAQDAYYEDTDPSAVTEFRTTLDPYGSWVEDEYYGTVWTPSPTVVGADFAPYVTAGHWYYGDDYVWVSDYDWGWAPFHYGRWVWIAGRGWSWIPGRRYSGAWVTWRTGYDGWGYVGWAPLGPTWYWRGGYAYHLGWVAPTPYVFCAHEHLFTPNVGTRIVAGAQVAAVGQHTRPYTPATPGVNNGGSPGPGRSVGGPPPSSMGISNAPVPPAGHAGLMRAQGYATPASAAAFGARAPSIGSAAHASIGSNNLPARTQQYGAINNGRSIGSTYVPSPRPYTPSQNMPQQVPYRNPQSMPQQLPSHSYGSSQAGSFGSSGSMPHYSPSPSYGGGSMPHYSPSPSYGGGGSMPHYSPSPSYGGGSSSFGGGSSSFGHASPSVGGGFSGGGGGSSMGRASPSVGGGFSGGHSGGGSHSMGGGRGGGGRR